VTVDQQDLSEPFEQARPHLRAVAYRMLGSMSEADDAVQETWLRLGRADTSEVDNLTGWLTTVVSRVSLDMLRSRKARPESSLEAGEGDAIPSNRIDPELEASMADSVGLALLVVLETLAPAERLAFVLHDMFAVSFEEIAPIVGRSSTAARQLASRARRRVQGTSPVGDADRTRQREIVEAFLAAARGGDFDALLAVLDPDVVLRGDPAAARLPEKEIRGAAAVAKRAVIGRARAARAALIDGAVGVIIAPHGRLFMVLRFTTANGRIVAIDAVTGDEHLRDLELSVLE
jgi:RNA polymerase sigma factor (sigma-70 family)